MSKKEQPTLFDTTEALPLFSGTPVRGEAEAFDPPPASRQLPLTCPICKGTGEIVDGPRRLRCTCPAGQEKQLTQSR
jgi:hypothetical protein